MIFSFAAICIYFTFKGQFVVPMLYPLVKYYDKRQDNSKKKEAIKW
jgi:hypothetical protein